MDNYVVYHLHSDLSNGVTNVDSVTKFGEYIEAAKNLGMKAMAFSEHGNIFEWFHKKEAIENAGMKYIHAVEAYITEDNNSDHKRTVYSAIDLFTSSTAKKDVRISFESYYKREDTVRQKSNLKKFSHQLNRVFLMQHDTLSHGIIQMLIHALDIYADICGIITHWNS